jgi:CheY-like chemotaxis protein
MQFDDFESFVKDGLSKIYDYTLLESNPMIKNIIIPSSNFAESKGKYLRDVLFETIESLKPIEKEYDLNAPEWRTYFVLKKRYVEGLNSIEVAKLLSISERQYRRYLKRAINSISQRLWDRYQLNKTQDRIDNNEITSPQAFSIIWEEVDLVIITKGVINLLSNRIEQEKVNYAFQDLGVPILVNSDRVILRQILIDLLNNLMHFGANDFTFSLEQKENVKSLVITASVSKTEFSLLDATKIDQENSLNYWSEKLNIKLEENLTYNPSRIDLKLSFIEKEQKTVMIVDDQEPALRMFTRYFSRTNFKIIGLSKGTKVLVKAKELQPALILLDIMMPKMDGWEVLQSLKLDETTKNIPVIVCSAWGEPELAKSLGAIDFLRKPVRQRDLLSAISRIGILD